MCRFSALFLLVIIYFWGCANNSETEKFQNHRENILRVKENVEEINVGNVFIGAIAQPYVSKDYLFIVDGRSVGDFIHIFDKRNYNLIISTIRKGRGPGEIINIGDIVIDDDDQSIYVTDLGRLKIFNYSLDSMTSNARYIPSLKMDIPQNKIPQKFRLLNDSVAIGVVLEPIGNSDFQEFVGKWNLNGGDIMLMPYRHPQIGKKRIDFAVSEEHGIYVEGYSYHDLMTICDLEGNLKYNIYGRAWDTEVTNRISYYKKVEICDDKIIVLYSGMDRVLNGREIFPTTFLVFDINGEYECTLDVGYPVLFFCYDKESNRLIMSLDDEMQFAYLDLDGLID